MSSNNNPNVGQRRNREDQTSDNLQQVTIRRRITNINSNANSQPICENNRASARVLTEYTPDLTNTPEAHNNNNEIIFNIINNFNQELSITKADKYVNKINDILLIFQSNNIDLNYNFVNKKNHLNACVDTNYKDSNKSQFLQIFENLIIKGKSNINYIDTTNNNCIFNKAFLKDDYYILNILLRNHVKLNYKIDDIPKEIGSEDDINNYNPIFKFPLYKVIYSLYNDNNDDESYINEYNSHLFKLMIDNDADINYIINDLNETLFMNIIYIKDNKNNENNIPFKNIKYLLNLNIVNINLENKNSETLLFYAINRFIYYESFNKNNKKYYTNSDEIKIIIILIKKGLNIYHKNKDNLTIFDILKNNNIRYIDIIIKKFIDIYEIYNSTFNSLKSRSLHSKSKLRESKETLLNTEPAILCKNLYHLSGIQNDSIRNKITKKCLSALFIESEDDTTCSDNVLNLKRLDKYIILFKSKYVIKNILYGLTNVIINKELEHILDYFIEEENVFKSKLKNFKISYDGSIGQDVGGLTKQFFTNVSKQLKDTYFELFKDSGDRYILKKNISYDDSKFIGNLIAFFIINDIKIDFNLSYQYLGRILYDYKIKIPKESKMSVDKVDIKHNMYMNDLDFILYYYLDCTDDNKMYLLNIIKNIANRTDKTELVTDEFYEYYIDFIKNIKENYNYDGFGMKGLLEGFYIDKKLLRNKKLKELRVVDLDKLITCYDIDYVALEKNIFDKMKDNIKQTQVYRAFKELIIYKDDEYYSNLNNLFITNKINSSNIDEAIKYKSKKDFVTYLLIYWSGTSSVNEKKPAHKIKINNNIYDNNNVLSQSLPLSHTCFNELELFEYMNTPEILYERFLKTFVITPRYSFTMA
jgi:hypothetical protein